MHEYESKAKVTKISATSRVALKVHDNFFTVEYSEEREVPDIDDVDLEQERHILFDDVNNIVDEQVADIQEMFKKKR